MEEYSEGGGTPGQLRQILAWLEAVDYQPRFDSCVEQSRSDAGVAVRCTYDYHYMGSDELGLGPYHGSSFDLTVRDGEIVRVAGTVDISTSSPQLWEPFFYWLEANHPADVDVMYISSRNSPRKTEQSFRLWEQRVQEWVDSRLATQEH